MSRGEVPVVEGVAERCEHIVEALARERNVDGLLEVHDVRKVTRHDHRVLLR